MNRHHPYGGAYDSVSRRGGSPPGPGPDRSHSRFSQDRGGSPSRGRGFGRGRGGNNFYGGGSGYDGNMVQSTYDQGPPQADIGGYSNFNPGASQDTFYQNTSFGGAAASTPFGNGAGSSSTYNQNFGSYEDGYNASASQDNSGPRPVKRGNPRRERDDKVHDSLIEERIQRERPCRTLFIRNIKYETNSDDVRRQFEEHGEIKTFFDLIANRGMVFVTYYDLRAAERARERLQGSEISGRPIDVHYSLPRGDEAGSKSDRDKNQGTLLVTLRNSLSNQPIDDNEVRRKFQQFGDVKAVKPSGDRDDQRMVEFYDTRACEEAHDRLRHQGLQDGVMDIIFGWDIPDVPLPAGEVPQRRQFEDRGYDGGRSWDDAPRGRGRGRGGRGRGRGGYGGDDWDRREEWGRDRDRGRGDDDSGRGGRRGGRGGYSDRFDNRSGGYPPSNDGSGYNSSPTPASISSYAQQNVLPAQTDDRLEQARRVQQLLAALKQPQSSVNTTSLSPPASSSSDPRMPSNPNSYYSLPHQQQLAYPGAMPNLFGAQPATSQSPPSAASLANLPPNILALLQQTAQGQQPAVPQMTSYNMAPQPLQASPAPGGTVGGQPGYQQLMAYLTQATKH